MLDRVVIKSFKSLFDMTLDLGLVNVFIGANGSGKSNILEAIGVLGAAVSGRVDDEGLLRRGVRPGVPALYKSSFRGTRMRSAIRFGAFAAEASYEVELINPIHEPQRAQWHYKSEKLIVGKEHIVGRSHANTDYALLNPAQGLAALEAVRLPPQSQGSSLLTTLREYVIYSPNTPTLRGLTPDPQTRAPLGLSGGRLAEAIDELSKRARSDAPLSDFLDELQELIDWIASFGARRGDHDLLSASVPRQQHTLYFRDRLMADGRDELTAYDASEGALYVLFAAALAAHPKTPPAFAIDNVDAGLNPRLARALMGKLCDWLLNTSSPRQLLLTCHNPLVLDGLPLLDDRVRLFAVDRSAQGKTVVRRVLVDAALLKRRDEGWPLSRLWTSGHLGGVPNV